MELAKEVRNSLVSWALPDIDEPFAQGRFVNKRAPPESF